MSTLNLDELNTPPANTDTANADQEDKSKPAEPAATDETKINVVLDGPLSAIYTKALNLLYNKNKVALSNETQAMDAYAVALRVIGDPDLKVIPAEPKYKDITYAYITDQNYLNKLGANAAFEAIERVVTSNAFKGVVVCIETNKEDLCTYSKATMILEDYLNKCGIPVYYSRDAFMQQLS